MRAPSSDNEASLRAARVSHRSSFQEVSILLAHASAGVIVPALLRRHGLDPVYAWMRSGIEFTTIFSTVWITCRTSPRSLKIKSWHYFDEDLKLRHFAEQKEIREELAALNRSIRENG